MPYCPQCRDEYVEGVARCPDCEVDLVADLSDAPPPPVDAVAEDATPDRTLAYGPAEIAVYWPHREGAEAGVALLLSVSIPARLGEECEEGWPIEVPAEFATRARRFVGYSPDLPHDETDIDPDDVTLLERSMPELQAEGEQALNGLVRLLVRGRGSVVYDAAALLAGLGEAGAAALGQALVAAVARDSATLTTAALKALREQKRAALPPGLTDLARNETPAVRIRALRAMAGLGGAPSVPHAVALLRDPDAEVREEAADAIWELSKGRIDLDLDRDPRDVEEDIRILEERHGG